MKCNYCGVEWDSTNGSDVCPSCNRQNSDKIDLSNCSITHEIMKGLAQEYGDDLFSEDNKGKLTGLVSDYICRDTNTRNNIHKAVKFGIGTEFYNNIKSPEAIIDRKRIEFKKLLLDNDDKITDSVATYIVDCFAYALGLIRTIQDVETLEDIKKQAEIEKRREEERLRLEKERLEQLDAERQRQNNEAHEKRIMRNKQIKKFISFMLLFTVLFVGGYVGYKYFLLPVEAKDKEQPTLSEAGATESENDNVEQESTSTAENRNNTDNSKWVDSSDDVIESVPADKNSTPAKEDVKPQKKDETLAAVTPKPSAPQKEESYTAAAPVSQAGYKTVNYPSGETYTGYVNDMGLKHGKGTYVWRSGNKYVGDWVNDKATGTGIYYSSEGWRYEGEFLNAQFHGKGTYISNKNKKTTGVWSYGKKQ